MARTDAPAFTKASTRCDPIKPSAPVTRILCPWKNMSGTHRSCSPHTGRNSERDGITDDIGIDQGMGPNGTSRTNRCAHKHHNMASEPHSFTYPDRLGTDGRVLYVLISIHSVLGIGDLAQC